MDKENEKGADFLLGLTGLRWWTPEDDIKASATKHAPGLLKSVMTAFNARNGKSLGRVLVRFQALDQEQSEKIPELILKDLAIDEAKVESFNGNEAFAKQFFAGEPPAQQQKANHSNNNNNNMPRGGNGNLRGVPPGFSAHPPRMPPPHGYPPQIPGLPPLPPGFGLPPPPAFMHMMWGQPPPGGGVGNAAPGTKQVAPVPPVAAFPGGVGNGMKQGENNDHEHAKVNGDVETNKSDAHLSRPSERARDGGYRNNNSMSSRRRTSRSRSRSTRSRSRSPLIDARRVSASRRSRSPDYYSNSRRREGRRSRSISISRSRSRSRSRSPKRRRGGDEYEYERGYRRSRRRSRSPRRGRSRSRSSRRTRDRTGVVARLGDDKVVDDDDHINMDRGDNNEKGGSREYSGRSSRRRRGGRKSKRNHSGSTSNGNTGAGNTTEEFSKKRSKSGRR